VESWRPLAAIAGRTVEAKCASGSASATTGPDGSYRIDASALTLPCALRVTTADGTKLHSLALGSSGAVTANLTPATELVVARAAGADPDAYFSAFAAAAANTLSGAKVQAADAAVVDMIKGSGVDLSGVGGALAGALVAANGAIAGNAYDKALDALKVSLAGSGTTLPALTAAVALSSPDAPALAVAATPSLPPELLLQPAAVNCAALRSGRYLLIIAETGYTPISAKIMLTSSILPSRRQNGGGRDDGRWQRLRS